MSEERKETETTENSGVSRRNFIKNTAAAAGAATVVGSNIAAMAEEKKAPGHIEKREPSDTINIGYIGVGVRGRQHMRFTGFAHPDDMEQHKTATKNLPRKLNVRAYAMSDCYDWRRNWAKEAVPDIQLYPKYQDLLNDKNVDAIFIGTSDHNHAPVGIDACQAGKHIYSEKPFAQNMEEVRAYRDAVKKAGIVFQLGHQTRSGTMMEKARKALGSVYPDGAIGKVSLIETYTNRNNPNGAWIYKYEGPNPGPDNIDWEAFTNKGPKREFDLDRFFRFRKYYDYGTGQAGDLLSHEMDAIQQITGLGIPDTCTSTGGLFVYQDGRETPDVFQSTFKYDDPGLIVTYDGTLANARHRERTFFGRDGVLDMSTGLKLIADKFSDKYAEMMEDPDWNWIIPVRGLDMAQEEEDMKKVLAATSATTEWTAFKGIYEEIIDGKPVNVTGLHVLNFVDCIREGNLKTNCDIDMAFEEGVIVHMSNQAYARGRTVRWDKDREEIVNA